LFLFFGSCLQWRQQNRTLASRVEHRRAQP
jgi:hypothetical protein